MKRGLLLLAAIAAVLVSCGKSGNTPDVKATNPFVGIWQSSTTHFYKFNSDNTFEEHYYSYGATGIGNNQKLTSSACIRKGTYEYTKKTGILVMAHKDDIEPVTGGKSGWIFSGSGIDNYLVLTEPFTSESNTLTMENMSTLTTFSLVRVRELNNPASLKGRTLSSDEYPGITIEFTSDTECLIRNNALKWVLPPAPCRYVQCLWGSFLTSDPSDEKWNTAILEWEDKYLNEPVMRGEITEQEYSEFCYAYGHMLYLFSNITTDINDDGTSYLKRWMFSDPGHFTISHGEYTEILFSGILH